MNNFFTLSNQNFKNKIEVCKSLKILIFQLSYTNTLGYLVYAKIKTNTLGFHLEVR